MLQLVQRSMVLLLLLICLGISEIVDISDAYYWNCTGKDHMLLKIISPSATNYSCSLTEPGFFYLIKFL